MPCARVGLAPRSVRIGQNPAHDFVQALDHDVVISTGAEARWIAMVPSRFRRLLKRFYRPWCASDMGFGRYSIIYGQFIKCVTCCSLQLIKLLPERLLFKQAGPYEEKNVQPVLRMKLFMFQELHTELQL